MRRTTLVSLLLALAAGCSDPSAADYDAVAREGLALTLSASSLSIAPGDTARLVARLANHNDHAVRLDFSGGCQVLPHVEDAAGSTVYPEGGAWLCTAALTSLELAPREVREQTFAWTGEVRGHDPRTFAPVSTPLPAGTYRAYATLAGTLHGQRVMLRSNTETVQVR
ncbi:MAG TPA: BsuPI-related putative proteinase inhibitor [Longimicrobiaceae bacterium]|nr:BsuPI-related putative proteinase inhibitor [Longimicrobiaceae bacterium]